MVVLAVYAGNTKWGKPLGAALLVILITAVVANMGLIPSASNTIPLYDGIFHYLAPIAIFYLMLDVNLSSIKKAGAPMIGLFLLGSLATVAGILIAWFLIAPDKTIGADSSIIAGMLTGTYTGGSVNFNAVALEYDFQNRGILYAGTIAVDNVVTTAWIVVTLALPKLLRNFWKDKKGFGPSEASHPTVDKEVLDMRSLAWLLFLGPAALYLSNVLAELLPGVPSILILTTLGIILAQTRFVSKLKGAHTLGLYAVFVFLAVIGAYCEVAAVVELKDVGLVLLLFTGLAVLMHGLLLVLLGGLVYRDW
ncbi:MAG: DUF819 family protein, partial [Croceitalea sp.]|nr:DUF819 family protein [Croceitalea sp.]